MSIINNTIRIGNFTSSNIVALLSRDKSGKSFGKPALTYIQEKNMERHMGLPIATESDARPLQWGKMCERLVFEELSTAYTLCSQETIQHPTIDCWSGSPDGITNDTCFDIKCPQTRKSWFLLTMGGTATDSIFHIIDGFELNGVQYPAHTDGEKYYWQIVSNAILTGKKYGELIVFMPHLEQLNGIREEAKFQGINWIAYSDDEALPYVNDSTKSICTIRFEIPQKDIDQLTEAVTEAGKLLIPRPVPIVTIHDTVNDIQVKVVETIKNN